MTERNPHVPIVDIGNMTPPEADAFLGKPDPNDKRALPFILVGFGFIVLLWIVAFIFL